MCRSTASILVVLLATLNACFLAMAAPAVTTIKTTTTTITVATSTTTITLSRVSSSVATTANPVPATSSMSSSATSTPSAGDSWIQAAMNSTNYYRQAYEARPLSWNSTLATYASSYAQQCIWKHSGGPFGENLAAGYATVALAIDAWGDEESKYDWAKQGFFESTGHFTQLVWTNTTSVGCGLVQCSNDAVDGVKGPYLVCEYSPRGNVEGEFRYNVRKGGVGLDGKLAMGSGERGANARGSVAALAVAYLVASVLMCV